MKPHFPILDGLRGTAALLVVIFHLFEACYPAPANHPISHGFLAVDFFFMLSGFVVGYAYDDRWGKMTVKEFLTIRLIRLHPLVIAGVLIGAIGFLIDPNTRGVSLLKLLGVVLISLTLLPSPDIRGWSETHSLDGPCWSLFQEYIANVLYALWGRRMGKTALYILVVVSAVALIITACWHGNLASGYSFRTSWIAIIRMMFPFFGGLLLFRAGKLIKMPMAYVVCSLALFMLFSLPAFKYNGLYEALCVIVAFPIVVAIGAGSQIKGRWAKLCKFSGDISYPIYILHYPFIYIYTMWVISKKPPPQQIVPVAIGLFFFFIILAYVALRLYDVPVRIMLKKKFLAKKLLPAKLMQQAL